MKEGTPHAGKRETHDANSFVMAFGPVNLVSRPTNVQGDRHPSLPGIKMFFTLVHKHSDDNGTRETATYMGCSSIMSALNSDHNDRPCYSRQTSLFPMFRGAASSAGRLASALSRT